MLKVFMIEWWNDECKQYRQEYYRNLQQVCDRVTFLSDTRKDANPEVSTIYVD